MLCISGGFNTAFPHFFFTFLINFLYYWETEKILNHSTSTKIMKKILLVTITLLTLNVFSQELTERQIENNINEYMQFLKDEGYSPSISESGELDFKYEGSTYTIERQKYSNDFAM